MLIRGSNAVGYTSYPDNVVTEFVKLAAKNGIDVFRVFDCFNDVDQMRVCIDAVREAGKVAEVKKRMSEESFFGLTRGGGLVVTGFGVG